MRWSEILSDDDEIELNSKFPGSETVIFDQLTGGFTP